MNATTRGALVAAMLEAVDDVARYAEEITASSEPEIIQVQLRVAVATAHERAREILEAESKVEHAEGGPDANLDEQRRICADILNDEPSITAFDIRRLAVLVHTLDAWLYEGGALPASWGSR